MSDKPTAKILTANEEKYIHKLIEFGDSRKALREVFGKFAPARLHDEILAKPLAQKMLKRLREQAKIDYENTSIQTLKKLKALEDTHIGHIVDLKTGAVKDDIDEEHLHAIKSIKFDPETGQVVQLQMADKLSVINTKMKYHGLLNRKVDVNVNLSIAEQLKSGDVDDEEVDGFLEKMLGHSVGETQDAEIVEEDEDA